MRYLIILLVILTLSSIQIMMMNFRNQNVPVDPSISLSSIVDQVQYCSSESTYLFQNIPEFMFPTNTLLGVYIENYECDNLLFVFFSFYIPNGKVTIMNDHMNPIFQTKMTKKMIDMIDRIDLRYYKNFHFSIKNRIPKIDVSRIVRYSDNMYYYEDDKFMNYTIIETVDGTYVCGQRML